MKPFSLEEYLKNPSRKVVTRDGDNARIICTDARGDYPVIALVEKSHESRDMIYSYTKGGYFYVTENPSPFDLFFAPEKHEGWATIYGKFLTGEIFSTKEEAEEYVKRCGTKGFVAIAKIEWEE